MKKILYILIAVIISASCNEETSENNSDIEIPVRVIELKPTSIKEVINTTGTVMATSEALLKSEIQGTYTLQINATTGKLYTMGDRVKKGDLIIKLEDKEYENGIAIDAKELDFKIKEQNYTKQKSLYKKGGVTLIDMRNSEVSLINSKYSKQNAILKLNKLRILATFDGIIVDLPYYTVGNKIKAGSNMVKIMSYKTMIMNFNLPAKNFTKIKKNQKVIISNYNLPDDTLYGKISEISPEISTETRTFKGKIVINNPKLKLRPGMFINSDIVTKNRKNTIVIPKEIITTQYGKKYVFIAKNKTAKRIHIKTGLESHYDIEVVKGLKLKDRLIIEGYQTLRDRSKIKILR